MKNLRAVSTSAPAQISWGRAEVFSAGGLAIQGFGGSGWPPAAEAVRLWGLLQVLKGDGVLLPCEWDKKRAVWAEKLGRDVDEASG